ncbi:hypothetical protein B0H10DRAFT_2072297 [Mycena sp. CBHHK59/15]|nr:hypothetical protein B0H10DRAFT_2072297 [Mycena sp. CBHHK59/15]
MTQWPTNAASNQASNQVTAAAPNTWPDAQESVANSGVEIPVLETNSLQSSDVTGKVLWKTPPLTFFDDSAGKFYEEIDKAHSIIREYTSPTTSPTDGVLYFAAAGRNCVGHVTVSNRLSSFETLAAEFLVQVQSPALIQLVYGHGRVIRQSESGLKSTFIVTEEAGWLEDGSEVKYDWVQPTVGQLPINHALQLARDFSFVHRPLADFEKVIRLMCPYMMQARQNLLLQYVYAVLAVLFRLPDKLRRAEYLDHQAAFLVGQTRAEWSASEASGIGDFFDLFTQSRKAITNLMETLFVSISLTVVNLRPTSSQQEAAEAVGSFNFLWWLNTSRAFILGRQEGNMTFLQQIGPLSAVLGDAVHPSLRYSRLEHEYADYAQRALENGDDLPVLPSTPIRIGRDIFL